MGKRARIKAKAKAETGSKVEKEVKTIESRLTEAEKRQLEYKTQKEQYLNFAKMAGFKELIADIKSGKSGQKSQKIRAQQDALSKFIKQKGKSGKYGQWEIIKGYTVEDIEALNKGKEEQATTSTAETQPRLVEPRPDRTIEAAAVIQARFRGQQARQRQRAVGEIEVNPMLEVDPYPNPTTQQQALQNQMFEMTRRQHERRLQPALRYRLENAEQARLRNIEEAKITREWEMGQVLEGSRRKLKQTEPIRGTTGEEELIGTVRRRRAEQIARSLEEYPLPEEPPITEEELRGTLLPERPLPQEPAQWGLDTAQLLGTLATAGATLAGYATPAITAAAAAPLLTTAGVIGTAAAAKVAYDYLYPTVEDVKINDSNEIIRFNNTSINDKTPPLHVYTGVPMDGYTDVDMNKRFIEARNKRQNNILKRKVIMNEGETNKMQYEVAIQDRYNKKMEIERRLRHVRGIADGDTMTPNTAIMVNY